jgi:hypothetical protein
MNIKGGAGMRKHTKALATIMAAAALVQHCLNISD